MGKSCFGKVLNRLKPKLGERILWEEKLYPYLTWRVGGPAKIFAIVESLSDLRAVLEVASEFGLSYFVLGRGSNLLVSDKGFEGIVIRLGLNFQKFFFDGHYLQAGAATSLAALVQSSVREGFKSLTFAVGIPGSLGGALALNAGAFNGNIGDLVRRVIILTSNGELRLFDSSELNFGYRTCSLPRQGIIVEAALKLQRDEPIPIKVEMEKFLKKRRKRQPLNLLTAGSVFKNPPGIPAGKIIEESGCKGYQLGGAQVSPKHANFIINLGYATASDIYRLMRRVQERVYLEKGILLEPEVTILGEFED